MGILKKVLGHETKDDDRPESGPIAEPECPHTALISHWALPEDLGRPEKATYTCEACGTTFSYAEAQEFLNKPPAVLASVSQDENR
jgi:hypothetical protein